METKGTPPLREKGESFLPINSKKWEHITIILEKKFNLSSHPIAITKLHSHFAGYVLFIISGGFIVMLSVSFVNEIWGVFIPMCRVSSSAKFKLTCILDKMSLMPAFSSHLSSSEKLEYKAVVKLINMVSLGAKITFPLLRVPMNLRAVFDLMESFP